MDWWIWVLVGFSGAVALFAIAGFLGSLHVGAAAFDSVVEDLATILTATPSLRARFFADPTRQIGKALPARKYWEYGLRTKPWKFVGRWRELRRTRAALAQTIVVSIAAQIREKTLSSSINTDAIFEEFFAPIVRVSQRSFYTVFLLSWGAFLAGLSLIGWGIYVAVASPGNTDSTVVASVFGGAGTIGALGSVYAMAKQGIREATIDHARLRMVLTAFATQLGQLRALAERPPDDKTQPPTVDRIEEVNRAIGASMAAALQLIPSLLKPPSRDGESPAATDSRDGPSDPLGTAAHHGPKQPRYRRVFTRRVTSKQ